MFITNNYASFHVWWKENLVKYQKVSKYYDHDYRKIIVTKLRKIDINKSCDAKDLHKICVKAFIKPFEAPQRNVKIKI